MISITWPSNIFIWDIYIKNIFTLLEIINRSRLAKSECSSITKIIKKIYTLFTYFFGFIENIININMNKYILTKRNTV